MANHVCPWWLGYVLASPIRKLTYNPHQILAPHVRDGMTVLEVGPGMGFFSLPMAQLVGERGRIVCVDLQERMIASLRKRATKAGLAQRMEFRMCEATTLGVPDLAGRCDFALAFAMVHEVPDPERLFREIHAAMKQSGTLLISEPMGHVTSAEFEKTLSIAQAAGFVVKDRPVIRQSHSSVMVKD
jgi:ubiquinone/menaquinone biosynthesis C-methylase UbiE